MHAVCTEDELVGSGAHSMGQHWVPLVSRDLGLASGWPDGLGDGMPLCAYCMGCASVHIPGYMQYWVDVVLHGLVLRYWDWDTVHSG